MVAHPQKLGRCWAGVSNQDFSAGGNRNYASPTLPGRSRRHRPDESPHCGGVTVSVENLNGDGTADQPSIIYGYQNEDDDVEVRELARATTGQLQDVARGGDLQRPGDVIERTTTKSTLNNPLPDLDLPGQDGLNRDDCGDDIPAFYCEDCGHPVYIGRTCGSPVCSRCWAAAIKAKSVRTAGKLEGLRRALYARYDGNYDIDFNHVVASLPSVRVDSATPKERVMLIIQTLLEENWDIDGFAAIYHPYRIKKEYRKDQYEHGGEPGEGEMTWKDVLDEDDPYQYLKFEPHFHIFFPARRRSFDYSVAEAVNAESGWLFHRITKGEDSNVSVEDLDDLVHQLTYCFSHTGVEQRADRMELASRLKGDLHNCYIPDGVEDEALAIFCDAAPKLLGVRFANIHQSTCDAEVSADDAGDWTDDDECGCDHAEESEPPQAARRHPIEELYDHPEHPIRSTAPDTRSLDAGVPSEDVSDAGRDELWSATPSGSSASSTTLSEPSGGDGSSPPVEDARERCGGDLAPIREAEEQLEDEEWCRRAEYVAGLRGAFAEWRRRTDGEEELPWLDDDEVVIEPG